MNKTRLYGLTATIAALFMVGMAAAQTTLADEEERLRRKVDKVARRVSELRELKLKKPVALKMHTRDEIEKYMLAELDKQCPPEKFAADERAYKALGLLPGDCNARETLVKLYREQIAGLYDPYDKNMILLKGNPFGGMQDMMLAHELTHALQDQHYDLKRMLETSSQTIDRNFTISAVVEGGATVVMMDYAAKHPGPVVDQNDPNKNAAASTALLDKAPPLMKQIIVGPYMRGMAFTRHFQSRGWKRVDAIYNDFPLSAEQILHPEKYYPQRDFPNRIDMEAPEAFIAGIAPGGKWKVTSNDVLGEVGVIALIQTLAQLSTDRSLARQAAKSASGWDGDRLTGLENGRESLAVVWVSTWDTVEDASEIQNSLKKWVKWRQQADTDGRGGFWQAHVLRPFEDDRPGKDVICVAVRTPDRVDPNKIEPPKYRKTVMRAPNRR